MAVGLSTCLILANKVIALYGSVNPFRFGVILLIFPVSDHFLVHQGWSPTSLICFFEKSPNGGHLLHRKQASFEHLITYL